MLQLVRLPWLFGAIVVAAAGAACYFAFGPGKQNSTTNRKERPVISARIADSKSGKVEQATFGAGCFWGVESTFRQVPGVLRTSVGFAGGHTENPTYKQVCYTDTGHAEVVHLEFDPEQVTYEQLLEIFWNNHNPTTLNRQGPDVGSQYRSAVFYHGDAQKAAAEAAKQRLASSGKWSKPIVTQIEPFTSYYEAEEYHQQYNEKTGRASCHL